MTHENTHDALDEELRARIAALQREIQPERDLWPAVAAHIAPRRRFPRYWAAAAALAAIALAGAFVLGTYFSRPSLNAPQVAEHSAPQASLDVMPRTPRAVAIAASVRQSTRLDPKTQAVLLRNLAIIENSLDEIQQALHQDPGNPGLQQLLYQMYRNEAALLDAAQRVQLQTATGVAT